MQTHYTSRSAIEAYQECPSRRYISYLYAGKGIVPEDNLVYLSTGTAVHKGVEVMARAIQKTGKYGMEEAVQEGLREYKRSITPETLRHHKLELQKAKEFAYHEQLAMVEALIRCWGLIEAPVIVDRFRIVGVEFDVANTIYKDDSVKVVLESKADLVLEERRTGYYYGYSLKTCKQWDKRSQEGFGNDLQGITEIWGTEQYFAKVNRQRAVKGLGKKYPNKLMGVRFCFLVKGGTAEQTDASNSGTGVWFTYNPFIRGYRSATKAAGFSFAHSWTFENATNKSGRGTLGKGWEPFFVWEEYKGGVRQWMEGIVSGQIQPQYSHAGPLQIVREHVITPMEVMRREDEIKEGMREVVQQERRVYVDELPKGAEAFAHYRRSCLWPTPCANRPICWGEHSRGVDRIELEEMAQGGRLENSGWKWREPHHTGELKARGEGLVNIT